SVAGTIPGRQGPVLLRFYEQMAEPKWVIAFGVCASTGGFYQNYSTMPGADQVVPVDVYIPGCPPRPEQVLDALVLLQERIQRGEGHSQVAIMAEAKAKLQGRPAGEYDVPAMSIKPRTDHLAALPSTPVATKQSGGEG